MRTFEVRPAALDDAAAAIDWYESEREGLGDELRAALVASLAGIERHADYVVAPYEEGDRYVIRRVFVARFPYRVFFVETDAARIVLAILRHGRDDAVWRRRI